MRLTAIIVCALYLCGCANFIEDHYFVSPGQNGQAGNYFRLKITGSAGLSRAKYISGYYDENAVDLLFNELKPVGSGDGADQPSESASQAAVPAKPPEAKSSPPPAEGAGPMPPPAEAAKAGTNAEKDQFAPADGKRGAFVMIFSTNANAIADTIGNFADGKVTAQAITNLINQTQVRDALQAQAAQSARVRQVDTTATELTNLLKLVPTESPTAQITAQSLLRVLSAISRALGNGQDFKDLSEAAIWFRGARLSTSEQP